MLHRELSCGCWSRQARRLRPIHQRNCPAPFPHSLCVGRPCPALSAATAASIFWALTGSTVDSGNTEAIALRSARRGEHVRLPVIGTCEAARRWAAASTAAPRLAGSSPRLTVLTGPDHLLASHDAASLSLRPCSSHCCSKVGRGKEGGLSAGTAGVPDAAASRPAGSDPAVTVPNHAQKPVNTAAVARAAKQRRPRQRLACGDQEAQQQHPGEHCVLKHFSGSWTGEGGLVSLV